MVEQTDELALNAEEQVVVDHMKATIMQDSVLSQCVSEEMVVQFLMARKFEEPRAMDLLKNSTFAYTATLLQYYH